MPSVSGWNKVLFGFPARESSAGIPRIAMTSGTQRRKVFLNAFTTGAALMKKASGRLKQSLRMSGPSLSTLHSGFCSVESIS